MNPLQPTALADAAPDLPWPVALILTALAYALVGLVALRLAIPPSYAAPFYPPAGIALVAVLVFGGRAVPGVALGALLVNLTLGAQRGAARWRGWRPAWPSRSRSAPACRRLPAPGWLVASCASR